MNVGKNLEKMFSLEDKVVVFTGAAGGIGSAIAFGHGMCRRPDCSLRYK
ncbi:Uncharacterised protein [[Eubacterium] contortum]|uniref:Uncharacterized protein n=1 Tax=Faecalicatena contorta TaxID=39482 RepID=A0A174GKX2_9FIRM|nr:hypothetical protein [Faecalicatena contorta]CUO63003.1 Uncharacterised protein [[Eubacterium] contortum] [Faecalicatena contorta]